MTAGGQSDFAILTDYNARVAYEKRYGRSTMTAKAIRRLRRELEERGIDVDAPDRTNPKSQWYVAFWHERRGQPRGSQKRHADRECVGIRDIPDLDIRLCTEEEVIGEKEMPRCKWCGGG
jgi:hypothetical protein